MIRYFRYVVHRLKDAYEAAGWELVDDFSGTPHGYYACLMAWRGDDLPVEPEKVA